MLVIFENFFYFWFKFFNFFLFQALLVGYGADIINKTTYPYWLVKNGWGSKWGINGYIKILRNTNNLCGVMSVATYPILV